MPRFVILEHDFPTRHWDFMLELGDLLKTWRLAAPPQVGSAVVAEPSFDHRRIYLDYEGPISGGRGTVTRWDGGTFTGEVGEDWLTVWLDGKRIRGQARIESNGAGGWRLIVSD